MIARLGARSAGRRWCRTDAYGGGARSTPSARATRRSAWTRRGRAV